MLELVKIVPLFLSVVGFVLLCLAFTNFGKRKKYRYAVSIMAFLVAAAYILQIVFAVNKAAPVQVAIWVVIGTLYFIMARWLSVKQTQS